MNKAELHKLVTEHTGKFLWCGSGQCDAAARVANTSSVLQPLFSVLEALCLSLPSFMHIVVLDAPNRGSRDDMCAPWLILALISSHLWKQNTDQPPQCYVWSPNPRLNHLISEHVLIPTIFVGRCVEITCWIMRCLLMWLVVLVDILDDCLYDPRSLKNNLNVSHKGFKENLFPVGM